MSTSIGIQGSKMVAVGISESIGNAEDVVITNSKDPLLFSIPLELLAHLLEKYIPQEDKLTLRLVHPFVKGVFDEYLGWKMAIDDNHPKAKFDLMSRLALKKISIYYLTNNPGGCETWFSKISKTLTFSSLFSYPNLLQDVFIKAAIDCDILSEIIRKCPIIKSLELCPGCNVIHNPKTKRKKFSKSDRYVLPEVGVFLGKEPNYHQEELKYLSKCKMVKLLLTQDGRDADINCETALTVMRSICSSSLEKVVVQGWISERFTVAKLTLAAAQCLLRNPRIESFFFGIIYEHLLYNNSPITDEDVKIRPIILETLKKAGEVTNIRKFGISTQSFNLLLWKDFLKQQSTLAHVSFTVDLVEGMLSSDMFRECRHTLTQFILRGKFRTTFDFSWIEDCKNLKEICLHNLAHNDQSTASTLHAINVASCPVGLESLVLFQTTIRTQDILAALRKLKLQTLVLFKTGSHAGETGVTAECLKLILTSRYLQSILLVRFVASNPVEASELLKILQSMNDGSMTNHSEIEVSQVIDLVPDEDYYAEADHWGQFYEDPEDYEPGSESYSIIENPEVVVVEQESPEQCSFENEEDKVAGVYKCSEKEQQPNEDSTSKQIEPEVIFIKEETTTETLLLEPNLIPAKDEVTKVEAAVDIVDINDNQKLLSNEAETELATFQDEIEPENVSPKPVTEEDEGEAGGEGSEEENDEDDWEDLDAESEYSDIEEGGGIFDLNLDDFDMGVLEEAAGENGGNVQLILNLQNEDDLEAMLELMDPVALAAENNVEANQIQFGFVLDGIIDIQDKYSKRSRWEAEGDDDEGQLTYTLKISID